jgi:hypothetical protein
MAAISRLDPIAPAEVAREDLGYGTRQEAHVENPADYELQKTHQPPVLPPRRDRRFVLWFLIAAMLVALGTVAVFFLRHEQPQPERSVAAPADADVAASSASLGVDVQPIDLPPLDETDALVRRLVAALSTHPRVAAWLTTDGLIRNFVVVVENISTGRTPAAHLRALRLAGPFRVVEHGEELVIDPGSYERYSSIAAAIQSIDAFGAARLYTTLKPRLEDAYRELGHQESFDRALERAIVALLEVPVLNGEVPVVPQGALYRYEEPRLERLTDAQKQLARLGPRNARLVQDKLREVARQLGIKAERLPA